MPDPKTPADYERRYKENLRTVGHGNETANKFPCPFCAAPDWATIRIVDSQEELQKQRGCRECGRVGKFVMNVSPQSITMQFVQISGDDPPEYMGHIKRIGNDT